MPTNRSDPLLCSSQEFFIDSRLVVKPFGVCLRREANQVLVALVVLLREQNQMKVCFLAPRPLLLLSLRLPRRDVSLATYDRLTRP